MKNTFDYDVNVNMDFIVSDGDNKAHKVSLQELKDQLTGVLGVAVIRCGHCGQWGARFCECRKCGAPIE